jgi:hypothetical protein
LEEDPWERAEDEFLRRGWPRGTCVSIPNTMFVVTSEESGGDLVCKKKMVRSGSERRAGGRRKNRRQHVREQISDFITTSLRSFEFCFGVQTKSSAITL